MNEGKIVFLGKGFGFLNIEGREKDLFFHTKGLVKGLEFSALNVGDTVYYKDIVNTEKGSAAVGVDLA